jgi:23S rRNA pseudouridine1911/1915/1917 synthase
MPDHLFQREHLGTCIDQRLDSTLATLLNRSRSQIQKWFDAGWVVCPKTQKPYIAKYKIKWDDEVLVREPEFSSSVPDLIAEDIPLDVVHEDAQLLIVNKPPGLVVHPAAGHASGTLVNALLHHCGDSLSKIGGVERLGIVHRLDQDTSGLMLVAKTDLAHQNLSHQFEKRTIQKFYTALCWGSFPVPTGDIEGPIARHPVNRKKMAVVGSGKAAHTTYFLKEQFDLAAWIDCQLHTGRTHQIRVHLSHIGHSILGDALYGRQKKVPGMPEIPRQMLHAERIIFKHPKTGKNVEFTAAPPKDFKKILKFWQKRME